LKPLQDRLDCDGLNLHVHILARFGAFRQMCAFGFAGKTRRMELSPPLKKVSLILNLYILI